MRAIWATARADFLERVRRYSFLLTLLFAVLLGYFAAVGKIALRLDDYRGVYTPAWIGTMMTLVTTAFVSLVGFYVVKNGVERDRVTGVGQILAASPLRSSTYMAGKLLSNFAVLSAMVAVLALAAIFMQLRIGETPEHDPWALLSPFLLLALPAMALTAALALLFETLPVLRGGVGNVVWFLFGWTGVMASSFAARREGYDPMGLVAVMNSLTPAARAAIPGYRGGLSLRISTDPIEVASALRWGGVTWTRELVGLRLAWLAIAVAIALGAALVFDRFDARAASSPRTRRGWRRPRRAAAVRGTEVPLERALGEPAHLTPLRSGRGSPGIARIVRAEVLLALHGFRWWWYAVAAGLVAAQLSAPPGIDRGVLLGASWLWPILAWSAMGSRENRFGTGPVLFSCSGMLRRQLPAVWVAGLALAVLTGVGSAVRLLLAGQVAGLAGWAAGAAFVPSLALALGAWSRSGRPFEALFTALCYVGPMNHAPGLDFTCSGGGAHAWRDAGAVSLAAGSLVIAAYLGRRRQIRGRDG